MKSLFTNPFEITKEDTVGSAFFKGAAKTYAKGVVTGAIGLGAIAIGIKILNGMVDSEEEVKEETKDILEENKESEELEKDEFGDEGTF